MKKVNLHTVKLSNGNKIKFYTASNFEPHDYIYDYASTKGYSAKVQGIHTSHNIEASEKEVNQLKRQGNYFTKQRYTLCYPNNSNKKFLDNLFFSFWCVNL